MPQNLKKLAFFNEYICPVISAGNTWLNNQNAYQHKKT